MKMFPNLGTIRRANFIFSVFQLSELINRFTAKDASSDVVDAVAVPDGGAERRGKSGRRHVPPETGVATAETLSAGRRVGLHCLQGAPSPPSPGSSLALGGLGAEAGGQAATGHRRQTPGRLRRTRTVLFFSST